MSLHYTSGQRVEIRDAEWRIKGVDYSSDGGYILTCEGLSELVLGREALFLSQLENIRILDPNDTDLVDDTSGNFGASLLYIDSLLRKTAPSDERIHQAITNEPLYIAGRGTVVSELNEVPRGSVLAKTGAEGVVTAALPERGLGIAVKIVDGSARARSVALLAILDHLGALTEEEKQKLQAHISPDILNSRGLVIGEIRPAASWLPEVNAADRDSEDSGSGTLKVLNNL